MTLKNIQSMKSLTASEKGIPQVFVVYEYSMKDGSYEAVEAHKTQDGALMCALQNPMTRFVELHTLQ